MYVLEQYLKQLLTGFFMLELQSSSILLEKYKVLGSNHLTRSRRTKQLKRRSEMRRKGNDYELYAIIHNNACDQERIIAEHKISPSQIMYNFGLPF